MPRASKPVMQPARDYEVGYGKPPKHTQFKPGQSGNSKGRTPGSLSAAEEARRLLDEKVPTKDGRKKVSRRHMLMRAMFNSALNGNVNAFNALVRLGADGPIQEEGGSAPSASLTAENAEIFRELVAEHLADKGMRKGEGG